MKNDYIEKSDSSAAQSRALAHALRGEHFDIYNLGPAARSIARLLPLAPDSALGAAARMAPGRIGIPKRAAARITTQGMAAWAAGLQPKRKYKTILLGAPSGGVSHIGSILDAPFLTTHFLYCFRDTRGIDDVDATLATAKTLARRMARRNPDIHLVAHCDPIHDRPVLIFINHIRAKLLSVPRAYERFIADRLEPGGTVALINCTYPWLQYRVGPRISYQIGGLGGVPDTEYIDGSARIDDYLEKHGSRRRGGWSLRGERCGLEKMPESEWGAMPGFNESVRELARRRGWRVIELTADHPDKFGELAFELHLEASRRDGVEPAYVFADCFNQLDPAANLKSRLLPLWLPYYCDISYAYAERMLEKAPADALSLLTLHPSLAEPFDMMPLSDWIELFTRRGAPPRLLGVDPDRFPHDISYVYDFGRQVRAFCRTHNDPVATRLGPDTLADTARAIGMEVT